MTLRWGCGQNCNFEYAGNLGTRYRDWHTDPSKAPTPLYGDCL